MISFTFPFFERKIKKYLNHEKFFEQNPIYTSEVYCKSVNNSESILLKSYKTYSTWNDTTNLDNMTWLKQNEPLYLKKEKYSKPEANIALISLLLLIGTCAVALFLKKLRRSKFFGAYVIYSLLFSFSY